MQGHQPSAVGTVSTTGRPVRRAANTILRSTRAESGALMVAVSQDRACSRPWPLSVMAVTMKSRPVTNRRVELGVQAARR